MLHRPESARSTTSNQERYAELARENRRAHERVVQSLREAQRIANNSLTAKPLKEGRKPGVATDGKEPPR